MRDAPSRQPTPDLGGSSALLPDAPPLPLESASRNPAKRSSNPKTPNLAAVSFGPEVCVNLAAAEQREWLVTNGIGGFASGTIAGSATRRYHGLLFAALYPPAGRTLLVGGLDETVHIGENSFPLATHRWLSGASVPEGYKSIQSFRLEGTIPIWTFQAGPARLEKRIWMQHGENTTYVRYTLLESDSPPGVVVDLELKAFVNYRDFHSSTHAGAPPNDWRMRIEPADLGVQVNAFEGATPFFLKSSGAACEPQHIWYRDFFFPLERERGLDDHEDQLLAAVFRSRLEKGQGITLVFSTNPAAPLDGNWALAEECKRQATVLADSFPSFPSFPSSTSFPFSASFPFSSASRTSFLSRINQLVLAADQFIVSRPLPGQPDGKSVIAGYHWFGDWGRDTMIALPGLALATGRPDIARQILLAFAHFVDRGMLPNNFPDAGGTPGYNTMDATLWYFEAIRQYLASTQDAATLKELFPVLAQIIEAHRNGTRYNIHVDPADGLLYGGGPGVQLTWMDAKIGDWVVTPRTGKPVEINALWINALEAMAAFAKQLGGDPASYAQLAATAAASFAKFWNPARNCCLDVIDCPARPSDANASSSDVGARYIVPSAPSPGLNNDPALRPNQIFAVSLGINALTREQQKSVVDICAAHLLTPFGLRSLAPGEPGYIGTYSGGPRERDAAYHQGTVWAWLLGPFALAHYRVYQDPSAVLAFLEPLANSIHSYGLGTLPEIFDGDPPHHPRGSIAQAWTVAELLRAWHFLSTS